jgi:YHS domain-containing protein
MKNKFTIITLAAMLAAGLIACAEEKKDDAKKDAYPLKTCVVSGEELDGMGDTVKETYKDASGKETEVRFCCKKCVKKFAQDPDKYLKILNDAAAKAATVPAEKK